MTASRSIAPLFVNEGSCLLHRIFIGMSNGYIRDLVTCLPYVGDMFVS